MLGMVFTELIEMVESRFSPALADAVLRAVPLSNDGAYTAVGYYPHEEIVALVGELSQRTGIAEAELVRGFGEHLMNRFTELHPRMFTRHPDLFDFIASVDREVHIEVKKLYDQASLPRFTVISRDEHCLRMLYQSPRGMDELALGLLQGAVGHYRSSCIINRQPSTDPLAPGTVFELRRETRI